MTGINFINHMVDPVLPQQIPVDIKMREGYTSEYHPHVRFFPGLEGSYAEGGVEFAFCVHAIVDCDYQGQFLYLQVCRRDLPVTGPFGDWHYGFYYRGDDAPWDTWELDINYGPDIPSYEAFGKYVDGHLEGLDS